MLNQGLATISGQGVKLSYFSSQIGRIVLLFYDFVTNYFVNRKAMLLPNMASELIGGIMDLFQYR